MAEKNLDILQKSIMIIFYLLKPKCLQKSIMITFYLLEPKCLQKSIMIIFYLLEPKCLLMMRVVRFIKNLMLNVI